MKTRALCLLPCLCLLTLAAARPLDVVAEDDASKTEYAGNWTDDTSGGTGFGRWSLQTATAQGSDNTHAGFYIAGTDSKPDLHGAAMRDKAFGLYANGTGFEVAAAFRPFETPLKVGQSFSLLMENGEITKKFATDDPAGGSIGLTLRASSEVTGPDDYDQDARFELGYYSADAGYDIMDADGKKKLDLPRDSAGLAVTLTLTSADTYDLEITTLSDKKTTHLDGRKLGGTAGSPITSFCIFDRNGEANDAFFNGFQVLQAAP